MDGEDLLFDEGFDLFDNNNSSETQANIKSKIIKSKTLKSRTFSALKKEELSEILTTLPKKNEYYHIVSNGKFNYFTFLSIILNHVKHIEEFYGSTWSLNRTNVTELLETIDKRDIDKVTVITGKYFKHRETAIYATLLQGLSSRGMRFMACDNHSKIMLCKSGKNKFIVEGSANWTNNPRIEQNIILNSDDVYDFHKEWMDNVFGGI